MVTQGAKVIIVVAEDGDSAATAVEDVAKKGVKVIAYDRLIKTPKIAAYVSSTTSTSAATRPRASWP